MTLEKRYSFARTLGLDDCGVQTKLLEQRSQALS